MTDRGFGRCLAAMFVVLGIYFFGFGVACIIEAPGLAKLVSVLAFTEAFVCWVMVATAREDAR